MQWNEEKGKVYCDVSRGEDSFIKMKNAIKYVIFTSATRLQIQKRLSENE